MKTLVIFRGVSGAGKSTAVKLFTAGRKEAVASFEADWFHYDEDGNYNWKPENLQASHAWCRSSVQEAMIHEVPLVTVSNTSTSEKELKPYLELAETFGYRVVSLVVENRHGNDSIHNVPQKVRDEQEKRLRSSIKLQ